MPAARKRRLWDPQQVPNFPIEINWAHPLSDALVGFWPLNGTLNDLVTGNNLSNCPNAHFGVTPVGVALTRTVSAYSPQTKTATIPAYGTSAFSSFVQFSTTATTGNYTNYVNYLGTNTTSQAWAMVVDNGVLYLYSVGVSNGAYAGSGYNDGNLHTFGVSLPGGGTPQNLQIYADGGALATTRAGTTAFNLGSTVPLNIGCYEGLAGSGFIGSLSGFRLWTRQLSAAEFEWLNAEPWAMVQRIPRRTYSIPPSSGLSGSGASTDADTSAGVGQIAIAGSGASNDADISAGVGAESVSGSGASTDADTSAGTGTVAVSGSGASSDTDTANGTGSLAVAGSGASTDQDTSSGTGSSGSGASGASTDQDTSSGTGTLSVSGTGASTDQDTAAGSGALSASGTGTSTDTDSSAGTGTAGSGASGASTDTDTSSGSGSISVLGSGASTDQDLSAGAGAQSIAGTGAAQDADTSVGTGTITGLGIFETDPRFVVQSLGRSFTMPSIGRSFIVKSMGRTFTVSTNS